MAHYSRFATADLGWLTTPDQIRHLPRTFNVDGTVYELLDIVAAKDDSTSHGVIIRANYGVKDDDAYYDSYFKEHATVDEIRAAAGTGEK